MNMGILPSSSKEYLFIYLFCILYLENDDRKFYLKIKISNEHKPQLNEIYTIQYNNQLILLPSFNYLSLYI